MGKTGSTSETETEAGGHEQSSGTTTVEKTGSMSGTEARGAQAEQGAWGWAASEV